MRQGAAAMVQAATSKGTAQETARRCQIWIRVGSRAKASLGSWIRSVGDDEMNERVLLSLVAIHWDGESERVLVLFYMCLLFGDQEFCSTHVGFELLLKDLRGGIDGAAGSKALRSWET